jgi:hypothetical protein
MNKIKLIFFAIFFLILSIAVLVFNTFHSPTSPQIRKISEFIITKISGNGNLYLDSKNLNRRTLASANPVKIKQIHYPEEIYLMTDNQTSFEFYCFGTAFTVMPDSYVAYQQKTKELNFLNGSFSWKREIKKGEVEASIKNTIESTGEPTQKILSLSNSGKLLITDNSIRIWNYSGNLKFNYGSDSRDLKSNQFLLYRRNNRITTAQILPSPEFISPENKIISLSQPGDSVVRFSWKVVKGATQYMLKIYSSSLKENTLFEKEVDINRATLDLLKFEDYIDYYWEVIPVDINNNIEGVPSKMGYVKMVGDLLNKEKILKPPELNIKTFDTNGNLVLIEGSTDINSQLFINDLFVTINMDGTFIHTINFEEVGRKKIIFKLISASGIEKIVEKFTTIYDE